MNTEQQTAQNYTTEKINKNKRQMLVIADFNTSGLLDNYLSDLDISQ
jgi:hypothetical protein